MIFFSRTCDECEIINEDPSTNSKRKKIEDDDDSLGIVVLAHCDV